MVNATSAKLWGEAVYSPRWRWRLTAGAEVTGYAGMDGYRAFDVDPRISATFRWRKGNVTTHFGRYHQHLHQVGFSEMGMSSNFKLPAGRRAPVQQSLNTVVAASHRFSPGWLSALMPIINRSVMNPNTWGRCSI